MPPQAGGQEPVLVATFYRFAALEGLAPLRQQLLQLAAAAGVRGTILLAGEGVNGTICGPEAGVAEVLEALRRVPGLERLQARISQAPQPVFARLKVRLRREIVTMGMPELQPYLGAPVGTPVPPEQWNALIADPGTLVIDTRNTYEVAIGSFPGAIHPGSESFRDFPAWTEQQLRPLVERQRPRALALFCTGGVRCEKATAWLLQQGFEGVHHLQGGILHYLEAQPQAESRWQGECYVFDGRVAVGHGLEPGQHRLCHACGLPLTPAEQALPSTREGVSCHHCLGRYSNADRARFAERQRQMQPGPPRQAELPVLYSFRRCPYAIRARLALAAAGLMPGRHLEVREVHLRAKPPELWQAQPAGTVPVLVQPEATAVLPESLAIMEWALGPATELERALIAENDGPFKRHLDGWKYGGDPSQRQLAVAILRRWNERLKHGGGGLTTAAAGLADRALLPFVRQFAAVDPAAWAAEPGLEELQTWLARGQADPLLKRVMAPPWGERQPWLSPRWIYHLALAHEWRDAQAAGEYRRSTRGLSLAEVGFLHASYAHQVEATYQRFYNDAGPVLLLCINPGTLADPLRPEPAPGSGELFPHLYGPLPLAAVVAALPWRPQTAAVAAVDCSTVNQI
jgi:UPF0176 protein